MQASRQSLIRLMWPALRPYRWQGLSALAALGLGSAIVLALGQGVRALIDLGFAHGGSARLNRAALVMGLLVAVLAAATYARFILVASLGEKIGADLRRRLFDHVLALSPSMLERLRVGDVLSRMTADIAVLQALAGSAVSMWLRAALMLLGGCVMLVVTSPRLSALILAVIPVVVVPVLLFARAERRLSRRAQEAVAELSVQAEETLNALPTVQAYTQEAAESARFGAGAVASVSAARRRIETRGRMLFLFILLGFGAITLALWAGGREVLAGHLSGGRLSAFVFYAVLVAGSGATLGEVWGEVQRAGGAADRIADLLAVTPEVVAPAQPAVLPGRARGMIRFEGVSYRYPGRDRHALSQISLTIAPGERVALVGPSGAGKSTLFQLLLRFFDPDQGRILLDGVDIAQMDPVALRRQIALVAQDPAVFGTDLAANLRYGRPDADQAALEEAARAAAIDFLPELPQGFATRLGSKGVRLSGGQRQRVAIGRAILRDAPVLLLDEATSALDAANEALVQQALGRLAAGRTTLVIAHRLATVRNADRIVVLEAGRIIASGTHDSLMRDAGLYAELAGLQFVA